MMWIQSGMKFEGGDGTGMDMCSGRRRTNDCIVAMEWKQEGKRKTGRAKTTRRRTVEKERRQEG